MTNGISKTNEDGVEYGSAFIPTMMNRMISKSVCFRQVKCWHSLTYAGEGLTKIPNQDDASGCIGKDGRCNKPYSVCHRVYWNVVNPAIQISAVLSYPKGLGGCDTYFWEIYSSGKFFDDCERFFGENGEKKMEQRIIELMEV
jgi:hypothetical protein